MLQLVSTFSLTEMVSATEMQQWSFAQLLDELHKRRRLVLLYKSAPSAVVLDRATLLDIEEDLRSAMIAEVLEGYQPEGIVAPDDF